MIAITKQEYLKLKLLNAIFHSLTPTEHQQMKAFEKTNEGKELRKRMLAME